MGRSDYLRSDYVLINAVRDVLGLDPIPGTTAPVRDVVAYVNSVRFLGGNGMRGKAVHGGG
jgi:hypothetical protein